MSRYRLLKREIRELSHGRVVLRRDKDQWGVYLLEDLDAPFCERLDRITVCYSLDEVERVVRSLI